MADRLNKEFGGGGVGVVDLERKLEAFLVSGINKLSTNLCTVQIP